MRFALRALLILLVVAPTASGQFGFRRGSQRPEDVLALPPRAMPGIASIVLEHAGELALTDSQRVLIESVRRTQDSASRPWIERLDSLRPTRRPVNPNDLSPEQREEITARRAAIAVVMDGMRSHDTLARERTMAVLSAAQQERAAELENDERKRADEDRARQGRDVSAWVRRDGAGRPPED